VSARIAKYLARHRDIVERWPLHGATDAAPEAVVAIPALAEFPGLSGTLDDLGACAEAARVLVIVVVNHREDADAATIENNHATFEYLAARRDPFALAWCEAVMPLKDGVGLARKIGMDHAAAALLRGGRPHAPVLCLDADTRVDADYLAKALACFVTPRWGVVFDYAHPLEGPLRPAILAYELFLRYCELGMRLVGSPYAYTAMGSAMACTVDAYAAAGGMRRKQAGEDFYFLQALAKCGSVERYPDVVVRPAARVSGRVPFGTGRSLGAYTGGAEDYLAYHPESYAVLGAWLRAAEACIASDCKLAIDTAPEPLRAFLEAEGFAADWARIAAQSRTPVKRREQFHCWFDAFRTLKALHFLRDHGYPRQPIFEALASLYPVCSELARVAKENDYAGQEKLLLALRRGMR
jgi:hypothetical protein